MLVGTESCLQHTNKKQHNFGTLLKELRSRTCCLACACKHLHTSQAHITHACYGMVKSQHGTFPAAFKYTETIQQAQPKLNLTLNVIHTCCSMDTQAVDQTGCFHIVHPCCSTYKQRLALASRYSDVMKQDVLKQATQRVAHSVISALAAAAAGPASHPAEATPPITKLVLPTLTILLEWLAVNPAYSM